VVELGSGSANKTRALLSGLWRPAQYVLVDISREPLEASARALGADRRDVDVRAVCADYTHDFRLPPCPGAARTVAYFPGSTIGNFTPEDARDFLARVRRMVGSDGALVIGVDLPKDPVLLHAAYNDARGVTAAFNKNLLVRMNRELFGRFDVDRFWHHAFFNPVEGRVEMHLVSAGRQVACVAGRSFMFDEGESITTEYSYKYSAERFARLATSAGFSVDRVWTDRKRLFSVQVLSASARR
jgi:dimethylhistidine N-methyltransferase